MQLRLLFLDILLSVILATHQHPRFFAGGAEGGNVALVGVGGHWCYFHTSSNSLLLALLSYQSADQIIEQSLIFFRPLLTGRMFLG